MSYHLKLRLKFLWFNLLGFIILGTICTIAYFNNKLVETSITILLFYLFRNLFEKQYHASSLYLCGLISLIVFFVVVHLEINVATSILYSVILTFIITLLSYFVRDYIDNKLLVKKYEQKLNSLNVKCIENLTEEELIYLMPKVSYETIHIVYGYLHKPKELNASGYAYRNSISERTLYRYINLVKSNYESAKEI